jgi:outer membrane immunogenic protein
MKKILLSSVALLGLVTAASAADLPMRQAPPAPFIAAVPIFTWTGFYVGAQAGYSWGDNNNGFGIANSNVAFIGGTPFVVSGLNNGDSSDGFLIGGHVGYNAQFGQFVVGVEGDLEWSDLGGSDSTFALTNVNTRQTVLINSGLGLDWQGSIRARLGWAFDRTMIYATGGFAFAGVNDSNNFNIVNPLFTNGDDTVSGWTLGAGVEYAFTNNLTTRIEYRYTSYDNSGTNFFDDVSLDRGKDLDFHTVRVGVSYKF